MAEPELSSPELSMEELPPSAMEMEMEEQQIVHRVDIDMDEVERHRVPEEMNVLQASTCTNTGSKQRIRKAKRKDESLWDSCCAAIVEHQLGLSINCLLLLTLTHVFFPRLRPSTTPFFTLSYYDSASGRYMPGVEDLKMVAFCVVIFTGLRAATMDYALIPLARWLGIGKKKATIRFAEQAWLLLYYIVFWSVGMWLTYTSPYWFNLTELWTGYPTPSMTGLFKWYYLGQFAFWLQQIIVIHIEERRKDHFQMLTHHFITSALMFCSYGSYQTKVGNVILCLMDIVDLFFPAAKMLKYCGYQTACDITFGLFIVSWFLARHVAYLTICWSVYHHLPVGIPSGCYNLHDRQYQGDNGSENIFQSVMHAYMADDSPVCFTDRTRWSFLTLLLALQVITIVWLGMICRVAYGVLCGKAADDTRSDDEGEDEEEEVPVTITDIRDFSEKEPEIHAPILYREEEVGVEDLKFVRKSSPKKSSRRSKGRSSGISIPGHGDHKELLGRIGCDKPT